MISVYEKLLPPLVGAAVVAVDDKFVAVSLAVDGAVKPKHSLNSSLFQTMLMLQVAFLRYARTENLTGSLSGGRVL